MPAETHSHLGPLGDDDLVELRTVRDAVDCVLAGLGSAETR